MAHQIPGSLQVLQTCMPYNICLDCEFRYREYDIAQHRLMKSLAILFQGVPQWQDPTLQPVSLLPQEVMSAVH